MIAKLTTITIAGLIIGGAILLIRQEQIRLASETAQIHSQLDQTRQQVWREQSRSAVRLDPVMLEARTRDAQLVLESPTDESFYRAPERSYVNRSSATD